MKKESLDHFVLTVKDINAAIIAARSMRRR